jgi:serine/threonine protein kinase
MDDTKLLELSKTPNLNYKTLREYFSKNVVNQKFHYPKETIQNSYVNIVNNFTNSKIENIENNINCIKLFLPYLENQDIQNIRNETNLLADKFISNKNTVSSLKAFHIYINKNRNNLHSYDKQFSRLTSHISCIENTDNIKRIIFHLKNILKIYPFGVFRDLPQPSVSPPEIMRKLPISGEKIYVSKIINIINAKINKFRNLESSQTNIFYFYKFINYIKNYDNHFQKSDLEKILKSCDKNYYNYIYLLTESNKELGVFCKLQTQAAPHPGQALLGAAEFSKELALEFMSKIGYIKKDFPEIDALKLKRGFIQGICDKNNVDYLLKYQPNKSIMEVFINSYLKSIGNNSFLFPKYFFIHSDNSYFYIIEKYKSDLYKYFDILTSKNIIMKFNEILKIQQFMMNAVKFLHGHKIIHTDLKPDNIVINYDNEYNITDMKIIDFDVSIFDAIPAALNNTYKPFIKKFNNKKQRGTRVYMIEHEIVSYKNDIFSMGIIILILLYKMMKMIVYVKKKKINDTYNKSMIFIYQNIIRKINLLKDKIEQHQSKIKIINLMETFFKDNIFDDGDFNKFGILKLFILDCINVNKNNMDIYQLSEKFSSKEPIIALCK